MNNNLDGALPIPAKADISAFHEAEKRILKDYPTYEDMLFKNKEARKRQNRIKNFKTHKK